jgi:hypothetical protein
VLLGGSVLQNRLVTIDRNRIMGVHKWVQFQHNEELLLDVRLEVRRAARAVLFHRRSCVSTPQRQRRRRTSRSRPRSLTIVCLFPVVVVPPLSPDGRADSVCGEQQRVVRAYQVSEAQGRRAWSSGGAVVVAAAGVVAVAGQGS